MPRRHLHTTGAAEAPLRAALGELRTALDVPGAFSAAVLAETGRAVRAPRPPDDGWAPDHDATAVELFTLDPPAAADLDRAMRLARRPGGGFRVHYAIADVAAFVTRGGALDAEAHRRVQTLYFPDARVPLYPTVLSEEAASLLPERTRPGLLWQIDLDAEGRTVAAEVRRALVRSRARLDYAGAQREIDAGTAPESLALLKEIGVLRERLERERGGISLIVPEQEIVEHPPKADSASGVSYTVAYRAPLPVEGWSAQISLLTGMAAAQLMLTAGTGILRTLPSAPGGAVGRLRRSAKALGIDWPHHVAYAETVRSLDPHNARHAAFLQECTALLRGAGYTVFTGGRIPRPAVHAAVAAPYTHCTAPLRRLVDRYTGEICVSAVAGQDPPEWVLAALDGLPKEMADGAERADAVERECVDIVQAALLRDRVGEIFDGYVIEVREHDPAVGTVHLEDPAVIARIEGGPTPLPRGERLRVRLTRAGPGSAKVLFAPA
ncbi:RNB domain-containing ribonuclease [Streptomyces scopuliridis]|uniref:RNB domain-containing ribonuclease n=1 Tax=Streptomyces scopuliridis TaxID=452529 RepID=UPI002DD9E1D4|nr:RNB domain-containing ribonuclease [Streptomyces scopuliridis]WSB36085.1 RNB domain-containing ribonuclease [Streptomyces scopuliridis]